MSYPKTIDNGGGEQITFEQLVEEDGELKMIVSNNVDPGKGPVMHVHFKQDEHLDVQSGKLGYQILGKAPQIIGPGEGITFHRNVYHRFWNAGDDQLICKGWVKPVHNFEYFLTELYRSVKANGGERPSAYDSAWLMNHFKDEYDLMGMPWVARHVIMPLALNLGNLTGKSARFKSAPQPIV